MRCWSLLVLVSALACDAIVEDPPPPRAHIVRPESNLDLREVSNLTLEVALDNCSDIDSFDLFADGELLIGADALNDFHRMPFDCDDDLEACVELFPADLMANGVLSPVELHAEVHCASAEFSALTGPVTVAVSPFSGSALIAEATTAQLAALAGGRVAVQTETNLHLVDASIDRVLQTRQDAGTLLGVGGDLFRWLACSGADCGAAGQLEELSAIYSSTMEGPTALDCAASELALGPAEGQVTALGGSAELCWQTYDASLATVDGGTHPRVRLAGAQRVGDAVRMLATDSAAQPVLHRLDISSAGIAETTVATLQEPTAAALSADGGWILALATVGLSRMHADGSDAEAVAPRLDTSDARAYAAIPGSEEIMAWSQRSLAVVGRDSTLTTEQELTLAFGGAGGVVLIDDRGLIQFGRGIPFSSVAYGPYPDSWQLVGHAGSDEQWLYFAFSTPQGLLVAGIDTQSRAR